MKPIVIAAIFLSGLVSVFAKESAVVAVPPENRVSTIEIFTFDSGTDIDWDLPSYSDLNTSGVRRFERKDIADLDRIGSTKIEDGALVHFRVQLVDEARKRMAGYCDPYTLGRLFLAVDGDVVKEFEHACCDCQVIEGVLATEVFERLKAAVVED